MMDKQDLTKASHVLYENIVALVERARSKAALFINAETTLLYWSIGQYVENELRGKDDSGYGKQILVTLSQQLTEKLGKGFSYSALTRMVKVANCYDSQNIATLSQQLSWSHFIELAAVDSVNK